MRLAATRIASWDARVKGLYAAAVRNLPITSISVQRWLDRLGLRFRQIAMTRLSESENFPVDAGGACPKLVSRSITSTIQYALRLSRAEMTDNSDLVYSIAVRREQRTITVASYVYSDPNHQALYSPRAAQLGSPPASDQAA